MDTVEKATAKAFDTCSDGLWPVTACTHRNRCNQRKNLFSFYLPTDPTISSVLFFLFYRGKSISGAHPWVLTLLILICHGGINAAAFLVANKVLGIRFFFLYKW